MTLKVQTKHIPPGAPAIRDVIDFHLRWPEFRAGALDAAKMLNGSNREIILWLIALADRVGEADVKGGSK